jgi:hypothetical protein
MTQFDPQEKPIKKKKITIVENRLFTVTVYDPNTIEYGKYTVEVENDVQARTKAIAVC